MAFFDPGGMDYLPTWNSTPGIVVKVNNEAESAGFEGRAGAGACGRLPCAVGGSDSIGPSASLGRGP